MAILITGASGLLGRKLISYLKEDKVYGLYRNPPDNANSLAGDVTKLGLGLREVPKDIKVLYHLAANVSLGEDRNGTIWKTNVVGTENVISFSLKNSIPHLVFVSTAYTQGRNPYEQSKAAAEEMVQNSSIPKVTIFKPSIIIDSKSPVSQLVKLIITIHKRMELVRRKIEGKLRLPVIEPVFRIKGNPEGRLNLIQLEEAAKAIANINQAGTFWITHPNPPKLKTLGDWVGEHIMVKIKILPEFSPSLVESGFAKLSKEFSPYLWGDDFPSDIDPPPITKEDIGRIIKNAI